MSVTLLLITDGRDGYLGAARDQAKRYLPRFEQVVIVDDSDHELGFAGAIQCGWEQVRSEWVFHLEDDFRFHGPVPLAGMIGVLERHLHLIQVALKRQPVNQQEKAAGGVVEQWPEDFHERSDGGATWTEHRLFFTTNPSVYSSRLCHSGWPQRPQSERFFTERLLKDPEARFAFWGAKYDDPLVEHIGERVGVGY